MKPEVVFGLENATWPALLVNTAGAVMLANAAAKNVFGAALTPPAAQLATIWSPENGGGATEFVSLWQQSPAAVSTLKFKTSSGAATDRLRGHILDSRTPNSICSCTCCWAQCQLALSRYETAWMMPYTFGRAMVNMARAPLRAV